MTYQASLIIVNYKTARHVAANLRHLNDSIPPEMESEVNLEFIVVDNTPQGDALESVEKIPRTKIERNPENFGYSRGCNLGAKSAQYPHLLFLNPDLRIDWENLRLLLDAVKTPEAPDILTIPQYSESAKLQRCHTRFTTSQTLSPIRRSLQRTFRPKTYPNPRTPPHTLPPLIPVDWVTGSFVSISLGNFNRIGGWNEDFFLYHEDEELCRRAKRNGLTVGMFTRARATHSHASSTRIDRSTLIRAKSELLISKHHYLSGYEEGGIQSRLCCKLRTRTYRKRRLTKLLNALTGGKLSKLSVKTEIYALAGQKFEEAEKSGHSMSSHSINHPNAQRPSGRA